MGLLSKKNVPVKIYGQNVPNAVAKLEKKGLEHWKIATNEQNDERIIQAIETLLGIQITEHNEILRRISNNSNFVEYNILFHNNNNEDEEQRERNENEEQRERNENYARWAANHLLGMGGRITKKYKKKTKKNTKHKKTLRKHK